jgi:hypothetical protein
MNSITSDYLLMYVGNMATTMAVLSNFMLIRHHDTMTLDLLLLFVLGSFAGNMYVLVSYIRLGEINKTSIALITSKKRAVYSSKGREAVLPKFLRSCNQYLRIHMSYFGYYKKPTSIRVIGKRVAYTVRVLILTKKIG